EQLFGWLFGGENGTKWAEILSRLGQDRARPLRLLIDSSIFSKPAGVNLDADEIHNLPYGLLRDPARGFFLFRADGEWPTIQYARIVRRCTRRLLLLDRRPLRLLLAVAEPAGLKFDGWKVLQQLAKGFLALRSTFEVFLTSPEGTQPLADVLAGA